MFRPVLVPYRVPLVFVRLALLALLLFAAPAYADSPPPSPDNEGVPVLVGAPAAHLVAFDAGSLEVATAPVVLAPLPNGVDPLDDVGALASLAITAVRTGNWWALAALLLSVMVSLARKFFAKSLPFLASDRGGFLTVVVLSLLGGLATALVGGRAIGPDLLIDCLKVALVAAGGFVGFKKVFLDGAKITEAGNVAAAKPTAGAAGVTGPSKPLGS